MQWEEYRDKFRHLAKFMDKSDLYIDTCLSYGKKLFEKRLPIIYDIDHFCSLVGYKKLYIMKVVNAQDLFYRKFSIAKKRKNEFRIISEPLPNLKNIQRWILDEILYKLDPSPYTKAFRPNYSIKDNAKFHRKQKTILTLDIENYFGSITFKMVLKLFISIGYSKQVAVMLSNLCVLENGLPQGAPTSAMLSNLTTKDIDEKISFYAVKHKIRYTRYADDLTFSGDFKEDNVIKFVGKVLKSQGFLINENKTRTRGRHQQQEVTGIVVNDKLQAPRNYRRNFRKNMHYIKKYGLESHLMFLNDTKVTEIISLNYIYHLLGTANFIININPQDLTVKKDFDHLKDLLMEYKK